MRNSILVTAVIAFLAGILVLGLAQSDQVKSLFSSNVETEEPLDATAEVAVATDGDTTEVVEEVVENEPQAEQTEQAAAQDEAQDATSADTEEAAATAAAAGGQTEISNDMLDKAIETENTEYKAEDYASERDTQATATTDGFTVNVEASLKDRFIGKADAPIVVEEFSSLTCPHCAFFHNTIFPKVKEKYIDTGKVRWVIRGFPLNEPALRAEMVARCAPNDQYLKLVSFMYENQPKWAFTDNPMGTLGVMLRVAGITNDVFNACATNPELEQALVQKLEAAATKNQINSTPTFIIDGQKTISGAGTFVGFSYDMDAILRSKGLYEEPAAPKYNSDAAVPPAAKTESTFTNK